MNVSRIKETSFSPQVTLRAMLGPLFASLGIMLLSLKNSPIYFDLSFLALAGVLICWKWEQKGLPLALLSLAAFLFYKWMGSEEVLSVWDFGLSISFALAFLITSLSKKEIAEGSEDPPEEVVDVFQSPYASSPPDLVKKYDKVIAEKNRSLDALQKNLGLSQERVQELVKDKEHLAERLREIEGFVAEQKQEREKFLEVISQKAELQELMLNQEKEIARLKTEAISEEDILKQAFFRDLQQQIELNVREKNGLEISLSRLQHDVDAFQTQLSQKSEIIEGHQSKIHDLTGQLESLIDKLKHLEGEKEQLEKELESSDKNLVRSDTSSEGVASPDVKAFSRLQGMHRQLKEQFQEKSEVLDQTRKELFQTEEKLLKVERLFLDSSRYDFHEMIQPMEKHLDELSQLCSRQEEEIKDLEAIVLSFTSSEQVQGR